MDTARRSAGRRTLRRPSPLAVAAAVVIAAGAFLRIWSLGRHTINADQAVVALMAHNILHGHFAAFYWGQNYGGGEPYVVAAVFALFGQSTFTLGLSPVLLDAGAAVLVWRIGRHLFGPRVGAEAALLFWIWPEVYIWQSTIEYGFRWFVLDCGLGATLLVLRLAHRRARAPRVESFAAGLLLGLGWWGSPEIMYFVIPAAVVLAVAEWRARLRLGWQAYALGVAGAVVGAAPWIEANIRSGFASLHAGAQPNQGFFHHLHVFIQHTFPLLLGLQLRVSGRWLFGPTVGSLVADVAIVAFVAAIVAFALRREALWLIVFCVVAPAIYAASPFTWYWADGRYGVFLAPACALVVAGGVRAALAGAPVARALGAARRPLRAAVVVGAGLALTLAAAHQLSPYKPNGVTETGSATWTSWRFDPAAGLGTVADRLVAHGVRRVYAGYWVAYPLMFASRGALVASDISYARNHALLADLEHHPHSAWLFLDPKDSRLGVALTGVSLMDPSCAALSDRCLVPRELTAYLRERKIGYRTFADAPFTVVVPARAISPVALAKTYRLRPSVELSGP